MKIFDVCGIGNALVDILVQIDDQEFNALGFEKGTMNLVEPNEQKALLEKFKAKQPVLASGGSVANSIIGLAQLGGKAAHACCLGDDKYGLFYHSEFEDLGIELGNPLIVGETTGTCLSLITPDSERTMRTALAVSSSFSQNHINKEIVSQSKWLFVEGYLFANPENGQQAIKSAIQYAKEADTKLAITFSDTWIIDLFHPVVKEAVAQADLIFANHSEACRYTGKSDPAAAFKDLTSEVESVVMTAGEQGAYYRFKGEEGKVNAFECTPLDMTGAGDMFAGAFLYGITNDISPRIAARAGCYLASKVITRIGARLHTGTRNYWEESLKML